MNKKIVFLKYMMKKNYEEILNIHNELFMSLLRKKEENSISDIAGYLLFVEYNNHIYTIGKNGKKKDNLLVNKDFLKKINATIYKTDRGGDITYHGPGQLVVYPILDMNYFFIDIHKYLRLLEEIIICILKNEYNLNGIREKGKTGVWYLNKEKKIEKICSIGIKISRWITMHGFAFNINTNLKYFDYIIPCGIHNIKMTSLKKILKKNKDISIIKIKNMIEKYFKKIFKIEYFKKN